jgi:lipopolysaccharide transport system ATP-binding protein
MSSPVLQVEGVSKRYEIYERPQDRLRQSLMGRLHASGRGIGLRTQAPCYFREFWALRDVSLSLGRGEALGILGRNGAGKSTLLQIIAGTLTPTNGSVRVEGRVAALLELGSGFSGDFTGRENVRMNAALLGLTPAQIDERFDAILEFADIGDFIDQSVKTYSSGMVLRLAFAVQTAVDPEVLIVDEALAVGDARFQKKCFGRLEQLRASGTTVLFVTHDTGSVVQFCTRALIIDAGSIVAEGEPQRIAYEYHRLLFDVPRSVYEEKIQPAVADGESGAIAAAREPGPIPPAEPADVQEPGSEREVRYGSKEAEIVRIGIRDASGRDTRVIDIHGTYTFYFRVVFRHAVANEVAYGFAIANVKGLEVYGTKSQLFTRRLPPSPAGAMFECTLEAKVPFIPGTYFLTVTLAHDDNRPKGEFLDFRFDAMEFQIVGNPPCFTTCVIDLDPQLEHLGLASLST